VFPAGPALAVTVQLPGPAAVSFWVVPELGAHMLFSTYVSPPLLPVISA
jgi:hypothetical protein